jgi:hypothetical protein
MADCELARSQQAQWQRFASNLRFQNAPSGKRGGLFAHRTTQTSPSGHQVVLVSHPVAVTMVDRFEGRGSGSDLEKLIAFNDVE